jgi:hypothetical protein
LLSETIQGVQVTAPICFSLYQDQPEVPISTNGFWRTYGYALLGIYKSDLIRAGNYRSATSWRGEDRDMINRIIALGLKLFRSQEVGLYHRWHEVCTQSIDAHHSTNKNNRQRARERERLSLMCVSPK